MDYLLLFGGLAILLVSGELLVRGATALALRFHISTLVIGLTVVSLGTSAPELFISLRAALTGHPDISIGNIVGSNIANLAFVLAITAIIFPIRVGRGSIRIYWPVMITSSLAFYFFILNGSLERWEGIIFVVALIFFIIWVIRKSRREKLEQIAVEDVFIEKQNHSPLLKTILFILSGCIGLAYGAEWLVDGAEAIALELGVTERVIALSIVAFGTSAPELATSMIAAFKKETDISIGNIIGSNIFNILGIMGITSIIKEIKINASILNFDIFWMLAISAIIFPLMVSNKIIRRFEGLLLFLIYIVYLFMILR